MITIEELEIDENYKAEMQYALDLNLRQYVVDWAQQISDTFGMAAYSAVNGKWDDIQKDIDLERIATTEAIILLDKLIECRLITNRLYEWYKQKWI